MRKALILTSMLGCLAGCDDDRTIHLPDASTDNGGGGKTAICDQAPDCTECGVGNICVFGACVATACGDGCNGGEGEVCDDGNETNGDGCSARCQAEPPPGCGNGTVDGMEECDDGAEGSATCTPRCTTVVCGDGLKSPLEECDDGNQADGDSCLSDCKRAAARCPNGLVDPNEECDDGNKVDTDGCRNDCTLPIDAGSGDASSGPSCGDGVKDEGEECDDNNLVDTDACRNDCKNAACGDGVVQAGVEECDAVALPTATCNTECEQIRCGDGVAEGPNEECDDGNQVNDDGCSNNCREPGCGDGITQVTLGEQCDDGNNVETDACTFEATTPNCQNARCGDGIVWAGVEDCDDGNTDETDSCSNVCESLAVVITDAAQKVAACAACRDKDCDDFDGIDTLAGCWGAAKTAAWIQTCVDLRDCMYTNKSGYDEGIGPIQSFCGTADPNSACGLLTGGVPNADGPCMPEWAVATAVCTSEASCTTALIGNNLSKILADATNPELPASAAFLLTQCDTTYCRQECTLP